MRLNINLYFKKFINKRFTLWLNRRMPSKAKQKLNKSNIFILPTRFGLAFTVFIILLFILGTNYQNNLIIFMCYLFSSLFILTMFYSFINMAGLSISAKGTYSGYQDEPILIPVNVASVQLKQSLSLCFSNHQQVEACSVNESKTIIVPVKFTQRGKRTLNRLIISSEFPLGLFRCWTQLQFDIDVITYPKPLKCSFSSRNVNTEEQDELQVNPNGGINKGEDFYELKHYQKGEPLSHVAWKQVAKGDIWQTKYYSQPQSHAALLTLKEMPSHAIEHKLSNLCYLVLQYHQSGIEFSLQLHENTAQGLIETASGEHHLKECLTALAMFNTHTKDRY
jgi:uncharacterized protein (DUF58 family)